MTDFITNQMKSFTSYQLWKKQFPEKLPPWKLTIVKGLTTLAKFALPLVLESIYKRMEYTSSLSDDNDSGENQSLLSILVKITVSLSLCYFLEILCDYKMQEYQLNLKKQLTRRIVENNIFNYTKQKQKNTFFIAQHGAEPLKNQKTNNKESPEFSNDKLSLWTSISSKMPVYVYNYHNSFLSLVFESLNIFGVCVYLYIKLSYSLIFGLILALLIMNKIISVTQQMQGMFFKNIQLGEKKLKLLKHFFNHLVEYKMTWLDKWIWTKIASTEKQYQDNIKKIKYLDVWCVSLWRFTSISISSVVVVSFYYLGIQATQTITPSTLIQFLMILTMPLNGLSWNIAGLRNSLRAINQLQSSVSTVMSQHKGDEKKQMVEKSSDKSNKIEFQKAENFGIEFHDEVRSVEYVFDGKIEISEGQFVSVQGNKQAEYFMNVLPFLLRNRLSSNIEIGYVEQNSWQIDNILQSLSFKQKETLDQNRQGYPSLSELMQLFQCHEIPEFSTITAKKLSGGEKMRINLVRAFLNCKIVVINSDLTCVDIKMREKISKSFNYLTSKYNVTIFCRTIQATRQNFLANVGYLRFEEKNNSDSLNQGQKSSKIYICYKKGDKNKINQNDELKSLHNIKVSNKISEKLQISLAKQRQNVIHQEQLENPQRSILDVSQQISLDSIKWETFATYYKSKYHIVFLVGIVCATICEHVYQFYMNNYVKIQSIHHGKGLTADNVNHIIILTLAYAGFLFVRAFYFAVADVQESRRLSKQLDQNIVMNQIEFYENFSQKKTKKSLNSIITQQKQKKSQKGQDLYEMSCEQTESSKKEGQENENGIKSIGSKLIYHGTSDINDISDGYSWKANILFNNIFTTISSILIVFSQIPFIGLVLIPIVVFTIMMNNSYQSESQRLLKIQKKVEQNLLKTVHDIEQGVKYIYLYNKLESFKRQVYHSVDKQIAIEWKLGNLKRNLNAKYKFMMILFLALIIISFGFVGLYPPAQQTFNSPNNSFESYLNFVAGKCDSLEKTLSQHSSSDLRNKSGKFAMLINYTITLANFMLFFTVSLGQTATKALSIQRIRPLLSKQNSIKSQQRLQDLQKVLAKIRRSVQDSSLLAQGNLLVAIEHLNFSYQKDKMTNHQNMVFQGLKLELKQYQKIQIRGQSGNGKTTLYKLLCSLYKDTLNTIDYPFHISFSPQHPLILPQTESVEQNVDPYGILNFSSEQFQQKHPKQEKKNSKGRLKEYFIQELKKKKKSLELHNKQVVELLEKPLDALTYKQKIIVNNLRAWLYGRNGIKIYDEPFWVDIASHETYILTTHQRQFTHDKVLFLENKKLIQK